MKTHPSKDRKRGLLERPTDLFWIATAIIVALWLASAFLAVSGAKNNFLVAYGSFGDTFGAVNSLFTGLAFAGLIASLLIQRNELGLQRDELKATRQELAYTAEQAKIQNDNLKKQSFETTYLSLLQNLDSSINQVTTERTKKNISIQVVGREAFASILKSFYWQIDLHNMYPESSKETDTAVNCAKEFQTSCRKHSYQLENYFRTVAVTLEFLRDYDRRPESLYAKLFRAKLSYDEKIACLLYSETGKKFPLYQGVHGVDILRGYPNDINGFPIDRICLAVRELGHPSIRDL